MGGRSRRGEKVWWKVRVGMRGFGVRVDGAGCVGGWLVVVVVVVAGAEWNDSLSAAEWDRFAEVVVAVELFLLDTPWGAAGRLGEAVSGSRAGVAESALAEAGCSSARVIVGLELCTDWQSCCFWCR